LRNINKAAFLDRDGVINIEKNYVNQVEDFVFIDGVIEACYLLNQAGYKIIIITNQAGIGRGYYTEDDFMNLTNWMLDKFKYHKVKIEGVYFCPHHATHGKGKYLQSCECRKPMPGMINRAILEHQLDVDSSFLVGDKLSDIQAGQAAGVRQNFFVRTGKVVSEEEGAFADGIFDTLSDVVNFISC